VIWIYAMCERAEVTPLHATGLAGAPLEVVGEGELLAVISRHGELPDVPALDALWTHEQVVERLMAEGPVLPMRFGSRLPAADALRVALAARCEELRGALDAVRGRVELAVRAVPAAGKGGRDAPGAQAAEAQAEPDGGGRAYLRHKLELLDQVEWAGTALHAPLAAAAVAERRRAAWISGEVLRASYLVERGAVAAFRSLAQRLQSEHQEVAILCTGPWPPYSFVDVAVASSLVDAEGVRV
jgi:Gas vesicle synthesis protein GvpL/GvpF